jgi:hypothetical protein
MKENSSNKSLEKERIMYALDQFVKLLEDAGLPFTQEAENVLVKDVEVNGSPVVFREGGYGWVDAVLSFESSSDEPKKEIDGFYAFQCTIHAMFGGRVTVTCQEQAFFITSPLRPEADRFEMEIEDFVRACHQILETCMMVAVARKWDPKWENLLLHPDLEGNV